ncbi:NAD(P)/FAD-dependent oxidoreductase [Mesorhizobium sp. ZC-5]|uniref:NAD(P)/FAD-dependent oxidoreductase n=1 Tax=Mesorhizobium sp. ZC-5 TaxID=2986066 RepID=UPI0021E769E1|nr:FAD-dependent oxidoreductase [Mesorhizobium sp. ZC-5]MCV3239854.1 FAD-binding oxidoreductase [Mesorhizobium sp. ZC-5]
MARSELRVVVVGAGIMGASIAWHLARTGARVTVLEKLSAPAGGVTHWSFGWVGTGGSLPSGDASYFALETEAVAEFARLRSQLGSLPIAARGALVWLDTEEETSTLISEQQTAGVRIEALSSTRFAEKEPRVAVPPALAAFALDDFAVEPVDLTLQLLAGAQAAGVEVVCNTTVDAIETRGGRVVGVRAGENRFAADTVVLASGASALPLAAALGISLPIREEPAVLMRFAAEPGLVHHLLCGRGLELRPGLSGGLVSAASFPDEGESGLTGLAERTTGKIAGQFAPVPDLSLLSVNAAYRPLTGDGLPLRTFLPGIAGLYTVVAHPGVILAPYLGRLAAHDIVEA